MPLNAANDGQAELAYFEKFCAGLHLADGAGPLAIEPFQRLLLADYFNGVIETLVIIGKKNGKTTLMAALGLYHLCVTEDADCVIAATTREQAQIMYQQALGFIRRNPRLQKLLKPKVGYRTIVNTSDSGLIRVLAAEVDHADGLLPTLALVDELGRHKKLDLYGIFRDGLGARDGQMVTITTAGAHEGTPLGVLRSAARKLPTTVDGPYTYALDPTGTFAMHEWALHPEDDVHDLDLVKTVNPLASNTLEKLRQRHDSPSMLPWQWARFACGIWVSEESWWVHPGIWTEAETDGERLQPGDRITLGFDGSRFHDATAIVACRIDDGLIQLMELWEKPIDAQEWEVPATEVDARLNDLMETYKVIRFYCDPPFWQTEIDAWAQEWGDETVYRFWTNRSRMNAAAERFRTDLAAGDFMHVADPDLTRHVTNTQTREVRGGHQLTKGKGEQSANDAAIAAVLAYEARCDVRAIPPEPVRSRVPVSF